MPATIRQKRVHYVVKKRIFNKKCLSFCVRSDS